MSKSERYFIEVVVAIILFPLLWIMCMSYLGSHGPHEAPINVARVEIASFQTALSMFDVDCHRFPSTEEGLAALLKCPATNLAGLWRGPYLDRAKIPVDPWGPAYVYKNPGLHDPKGCDVYSLGLHGAGGNEAIGNWMFTSGWNSTNNER